eukprot:COSAG06_NODE_802_length_12194_cov_5.561637_11_plen_202_part_00
MDELSEWGSAMGVSLVGYAGFSLGLVPTAVAYKSVSMIAVCVGFAFVPIFILMAPATVSSVCDDMLDQLNDIRSETPFLYHLYIKTIILPRQARDKHEEKLKKKAFPIASSAMTTTSCAALTCDTASHTLPAPKASGSRCSARSSISACWRRWQRVWRAQGAPSSPFWWLWGLAKWQKMTAVLPRAMRERSRACLRWFKSR